VSPSLALATNCSALTSIAYDVLLQGEREQEKGLKRLGWIKVCIKVDIRMNVVLGDLKSESC
jgi:hypothetical protein